MRTPFVAANWKMYKTVAEAQAFFRDFAPLVAGVDDVEIVVAPPALALPAGVDAAHGTRVGIAGQNFYWEREGAFTGEVSAGMLKAVGARYVIIGHSERRTKFSETDEHVNKKVHAALAGGLTPIVCVGETLEERERDQTMAVLDRQLELGLAGLAADAVAALAIAYEPVWAIGTGRNATAAQAQEAHAHIRRRLRERFGAEAADACRILYGGSVKPSNTKELVSQADVDGALVGGASLDPKGFAEIVAASRPGWI
jgi:triosephosphate isomerase (TIM)